MSRTEIHQFLAGVRITSLGTVLSRVLGMLRDTATASMLGLSGGVMDAFVIAFRIPNALRRLFGEGALTTSYLPVLAAHLERDRGGAWRLACATIVMLAAVLGVLVGLGEAICGALWLGYGHAADASLLIGLSAVLLPYTILVCLAAQVSATLNALDHFRWPALAPAVLNGCWLASAWLVAPRFADRESRAYVLAIGVLAAGVVQLAVLLPTLVRLGFRFDFDWQASREGVRQVLRAMGPMVFGLAVTQINTLVDSAIAWGLAAPADGPRNITWLDSTSGWLGGWLGGRWGGTIEYPLQQGAAAALYYGERLYQFPLGVLGIAVATVVFPLLSRHAARGDRRKLGDDLTLALRLVLYVGIPAGAGLVILAEPIARLLFERGEFVADDTRRTAEVIACYGYGVWAYCALPVIVRGYYALGMNVAPVRVGVCIVALNVALDLALVWPMAEAGLALATSISAAVQVVVLVALWVRYGSPIGWWLLAETTLKASVATAAMSATAYALWHYAPWEAVLSTPGGASLHGQAIRLAIPLLSALGAFAAASWLLRAEELRMLIVGAKTKEADGDADDGTPR